MINALNNLTSSWTDGQVLCAIVAVLLGVSLTGIKAAQVLVAHRAHRQHRIEATMRRHPAGSRL